MLAGCTPWPVGLAERYRRKGYWEDVILGEMLNRSARDHAEKPALILENGVSAIASLSRRATALPPG